MTKEQIYNAICDVAEEAGVSPEELVAALEEQNRTLFEQKLGGMPTEAAEYIKTARNEKSAARAERRKTEKEGALTEEVKTFRRLFPDVTAEDIPETVWADMEKGIPLAYAFAYHSLAEGKNGTYADSVNARNTETSPPPVGERADEGEISMEEVEAMSPRAVKSNFSRILRSIGKWKLN